MGFKGKLVTSGRRLIGSRAGRAGLAAAGLGGAGALGFGAGGGGAPVPRGGSGLYRVYPDGRIVKVQQKRRRRGYRMPRAVAEAMRTQNDLVKAVTFKIAASAGT
ncbi:MAG: hypothetical protein ACREBU_13180 [Nitrososphaera sp.]